MEELHRAMHLTFSVEEQNGSGIACPCDSSPVSHRTSSNLSHSSTYCPTDVKMVKVCISEVSSTEDRTKKATAQSNDPAVVDHVKTHNDDCNQDATLAFHKTKIISVDSARALGPAACGTADEKRHSGSETNVDPAGREDCVVSSANPPFSASSESCSTVGSGEMVFRSNSFLLHESDQLLSASLLGESSDMQSEAGLVLGLLPDVCEGLVNSKVSTSGTEAKHQELGVTFIQPCNHTYIMEEEVFQSPLGTLGPLKGTATHRSPHMVTVIDRSEGVAPVHCNKSHLEGQQMSLRTNGSTHSTPAEGKTFQLCTSEELDISGNVQTSTPVQSLGSKTFSHLSLSNSPLSKSRSDLGSPLAQDQQSSVSLNPKTPLTAPIKSNKIEIKRFAKPDLSNVKSKIIERPVSGLKSSGEAVMKASPNITHQASTNQTTKTSHSIQRKASLTKSTSAVSCNSPVIPPCSSFKRDQSTGIKRISSSAYQERGTTPKSQPRTQSETCSSPQTTMEEPSEKDARVKTTLNSFTTKKTSSAVYVLKRPGLAKFADRNTSSREDKGFIESLNICGKPQKPSPKADPSTLAGAAACDWSRDRPGASPSVSRTGGTKAARAPVANLRPPAPLTSKPKAGPVGRNGCTTTDMPSPRSKRGMSRGSSKMHLTENTGAEVSGTARSRLLIPAAHTHVSASKLPVKPRARPRSPRASTSHAKPDYVDPSPGVSRRPPTSRTTSVRTRLQSQPPRSSQSGCKNTSSSSSQASVRAASSVLKTQASPRPVRLPGALSVDKGRVKASTRGQASGQPDLVPPETKPRGVEYYKTLCERKNQTIQQLKSSFRASSRRFEAIAVVVQNLYAEHEDTVKTAAGAFSGAAELARETS
ncbi:nucleolar and coiled-body phosphoprotein 1-like [Electrophorus electricus]|uniref:nucleolar and coiled-body phosphoprotein 1-like n=1 Tax=Electrophorus electricus TaxID=8005 RepID=UPI0015CF8A39|nr:nucleolar and coiled-body phosphoprotein 1-like [Electrophorus electricus]